MYILWHDEKNWTVSRRGEDELSILAPSFQNWKSNWLNSNILYYVER